MRSARQRLAIRLPEDAVFDAQPLRINGKPVNPNSIKTARGKPLPADQRARFELMLQTRMQMMADRLFPTSQNTASKAADLR